MNRRRLLTALIMVLLVGPGAILMWSRSHGRVRPRAAVSYHIPEDPALRLTAPAAQWPEVTEEAIAAGRNGLPKTNPWLYDRLRVRLEDFVPRMVAWEWLPSGFPELVPYLEGWGFVWEVERSGFRLRVRYTMSHLDPVLQDKTAHDVVFLAAEPSAPSQLPCPTTPSEMWRILTPFLGEDGPPAPPPSWRGQKHTNPGLLVSCVSGCVSPFAREVGGHTLAECPYPQVHELHRDPTRDQPALLNWWYDLTVWSDGRLLLATFLGGQAPTSPLRPAGDSIKEALPPPPREPIEVKPSLTPEEMAREVSPERTKH